MNQHNPNRNLAGAGRLTGVLGLGLCLLGMAAPARAGVDPFAVDSETLIELHTSSGDIVLTAGGADQVRVRADEVRHERKEKLLLLRTGSDDVRLEVPKGSSVRIHSRSGDVEVRVELEQLELQTVAGDLDMRSSAGVVIYHSISGDLDLHGDVGRLEVETVSGSIDVHGSVDDFQFRLVSGDVALRGDRLPKICEGTSISGDFELSGAVVSGSSFRLVTKSGNLSFRRSNEGGLRVRARLLSGSSNLADPHTVLDGGGSDLWFESMSGDLRVR